MIYTDEKLTKQYPDFKVRKLKDSDKYDVQVGLKFTGSPGDLDIYVHPNCVSERVLLILKTDFEFKGWPIGRSDITIMGGNVTLLIDDNYICTRPKEVPFKKYDIVQISTQNDATVTILDVPKDTKLSVFENSSVRVKDSNIDRAFVMDSGDLVTTVPLNIIANDNATVIDLKHSGITDIDASDSVCVTTHNKKINGKIHDDATLTFDEAGKRPKTYSKKAMKMHEFASYVAKKEGGKSQAHIGDIRQILRIVDDAVRGGLSKAVENGVLVYE